MMNIFDKLLLLFGIRRINLDKPLTLLGHYYYDVCDMVYKSPYGIYDDVDWGIYYYSSREDDSGRLECPWESIKIISTVIHDDNDMVLRAGKIYLDNDKRFVDELIAGITAGKHRVRRKVCYPHYEQDEHDVYYHYNDDVWLRVRKEYDEYECIWKAEIEYILHKSAKSKFPRPQMRTQAEDRSRIMDDIKNNLNR